MEVSLAALNVEQGPAIMEEYILQCTICSVQRTVIIYQKVHSVKYTVNSVQESYTSKVYSLTYTAIKEKQSVQDKIYNVQSTFIIYQNSVGCNKQ